MTLDEIKALIQTVIDTGIAELEVQQGDDRVRIRRHQRASVSHEVFVPAAAAPERALERPAAPAATPAPGGASAAPKALDVTSDPSLVIVKSPIVGTFYDTPSPGAAPFVRIGDSVQPGRVLCIIESMKLMNEIEAEIAGTIVSKLVENGSPVEYGEALFAVRPL